MIYPLSHAILTQYFGEHPDDYLQYGYPGHNGIDLTSGNLPSHRLRLFFRSLSESWLAGGRLRQIHRPPAHYRGGR